MRARGADSLILGRSGRFPFSAPFVLSPQALSAHVYTIGISGSGKSKLLENLVAQLIATGHGCGVIDPHSLLIDDLLKHLVTRRTLADPAIKSRILYIDPSREDYVIPMNVLATPDRPYRVAASVIEAFRRTWPESLKEAPHFTNVMFHSLLVLIKTGMTLIDLPRLLIDKPFRDTLLEKAQDRDLASYFHDRYDQWQRDAAVMRESALNKVTALSLNPYLKLMLGQTKPLDFAEIMDNSTILLLDLGRSDPETNRLIGSLVVTGLELGMYRRRTRRLWNLTIDEFAGYVAQEGSEMTFAHVLSQGRKFAFTMTVAHQTLSQVSERILGALGNVKTKIIFGIDRYDAEYLAKIIGWVDTEEVKREAKTETQTELFSPLPEQWEKIIDGLRFQRPRQATVATHDNQVVKIITQTVPPYNAQDEHLETVRLESLKNFGIPCRDAKREIEERLSALPQKPDTPLYYDLK